MNQLELFKTEQIGTGDQITMSSREIAELTNKRHADVLRDIDKMLQEIELDQNEFLRFDNTGAKGKEIRYYNLPKRECLILVSGYSVKLRAAIVDRWQELEAGAVQRIPADPDTVRERRAILGLKAAIEILNPAAESKIKMIGDCFDRMGLDSGYLPVYAEQQGTTASLTDILEGSGISARKAYPALQKAGIVEQKTRKSTNGQSKKFWTVTNEKYGKNMVSPHNPRETQPHFYTAKRGDILKIMEQT